MFCPPWYININTVAPHMRHSISHLRQLDCGFINSLTRLTTWKQTRSTWLPFWEKNPPEASGTIPEEPAVLKAFQCHNFNISCVCYVFHLSKDVYLKETSMASTVIAFVIVHVRIQFQRDTASGKLNVNYVDITLSEIAVIYICVYVCVCVCKSARLCAGNIIGLDCSWANGPLVRYVKLRVAHALGMPETFSQPSRISDPDMHQGTCVTHVPWCMPGSLISYVGGEENIPSIPDTCATHNFGYLVRGPCLMYCNR